MSPEDEIPLLLDRLRVVPEATLRQAADALGPESAAAMALDHAATCDRPVAFFTDGEQIILLEGAEPTNAEDEDTA